MGVGQALGFDLPSSGAELGPRSAPAGFAARFNTDGEVSMLCYLGPAVSAFDTGPDGVVHVAITPMDLNFHGPAEHVRGETGRGLGDVAWLRIAPDLSRILTVTWFGGDAAEIALAIQAGADGRLRLAGTTRSRNLPVTADAAGTRFADDVEDPIGGDGFLAIAPDK